MAAMIPRLHDLEEINFLPAFDNDDNEDVDRMPALVTDDDNDVEIPKIWLNHDFSSPFKTQTTSFAVYFKVN